MRRLLLLLTLIGAATAALGYTFNTRSGLPIRWKFSTVNFQIKANNTTVLADGTTTAGSIQAAMQEWNTRIQRIQLVNNIANPGPGGDGNTINEIFFSDTVYGTAFGDRVLAITTTWSISGDRSESDILFNTAISWNSFRGGRTAFPTQHDLRRVAIHELGHAIGLGHPDEAGQTQVAIMNSIVSYSPAIDGLQEDDITGAQDFYQAAGASGPPANDNFANALPVSLDGANRARVTSNNFNATVESGEPDHDPGTGVSGGSIWFKWVAPSHGSLIADTRTSVFDSLLAIYTGSSVNALTQVAANDDESAPPDHIRTSRLSIDSIVSGTTYYFAVAGWGTEVGFAALNLAFTPGAAPTPPTITSQPASASVSYLTGVTFSVTATGTTPLSYQWQQSLSGSSTWSDISGATNYFYSFTANDLTRNGARFRCVVTNAGGSVTSSAATLTIVGNAPQALMFVTSYTVYAGTSMSFSASASGSPTPTVQWQVSPANSTTWTEIPGATSTSYSFTAQLADNGNRYRFIATNAFGTATSPQATLVVLAAAAPRILSFPSNDQVVSYGGVIGLSATVDGSPTLTYEWYRNGTRLANQGSPYLTIFNATTADSGNYQLVVRNSAGSATSTLVRVTVNAPIPPSFTTEPTSVTAARGSAVYLSFGVQGTYPFTYQWFRDGAAINGQIYQALNLSNVTLADAGDYQVVATNAGGSTASKTVRVEVTSASTPVATISPHEVNTVTGGIFQFSANVFPTGSYNLQFQWFKDGVALLGETQSTFSVWSATTASSGSYHCVVTHNGIPLKTPTALAQVSPSQRPWITARRHGDIVYFLASNPARITRFDLSTDAWLPVVNLPGNRTPTAMVPTSRGVFVAYGSSVVFYEPNLTTETAVASSTETVSNLFTVGDFVYFRDQSAVRSVRISTLAEGDRSPGMYYDIYDTGRADAVAVAPDGKSVFFSRRATSPMDILTYSVNPTTGVLTYVADSPYHGRYPIGAFNLVCPDGTWLINSSGTSSSIPSLEYRNAAGLPMDDMAFLADGTLVALRSATVTRHDPATLVAAGSYTMPLAASALFARGDAVYAFSAVGPSTSNSGVFKVSAASMTASAPPPTPPSPAGQRIDALSSFVTADGVLHIVSRNLASIVRWSPSSQTLLSSLPLRAAPASADYSPTHNRLLLGYLDGTVSEIQFGGAAAQERPVRSFPSGNRLNRLLALDDLMALSTLSGQTSGEFFFVYNSAGLAKAPSPLITFSTIAAWHSATRRLYLADGTWHTIGTDGSFGATGSVFGATTPLVVNASGDLIASGNGKIYRPAGTVAGQLPIANLNDAVWQPNGLFAIRSHPNGTAVQRFSLSDYSLLAETAVPGSPVRVQRLDDDTLVVLTETNGYLSIFRVPASLSGITATHTGPTPPSGPVITESPASTQTLSDSTAQLSVTIANPAGALIRWYSRPNANSAWSEVLNTLPYSGVGTSTLTLTNPSTGLSGTQFRVRVINSAGLADSAIATVTVQPGQRAFLEPVIFRTLGRAATANELTAYTAVINGGRTRLSVFDELLASQEFANRYLPEIIRLYYAAFGRAPDYAGLLNWSNHIRLNGPAQHQQVAAAFVGSAEFTVRYGNPTDAEFIRQLYRNVLAREAAQAEVDSWVALLNGGMSRSSALFGFAESDEFKRRIADEVEVTQLYFVLAGRVPTSTELRTGIGALRGHGQTSAFLGSAEFAARFPSGLSDAAFVDLIFQGFLRRPVDTAGSAAYVAALGAGTLTRPEAVATLLDSAEAANNVVPAARLYLAGLQRPPDSGGLSTWAGQLRSGVSFETMGTAFASSQEFLNRYGGLSNQAYVQALYRNVLGREADASGLTNWTAALDTGGATRGSLLLGFAYSQEAIALYATDVRSSLHYLTFLDRVPGTPELAGWYDYLTTLRAQFRQQMLTRFGLSQ